MAAGDSFGGREIWQEGTMVGKSVGRGGQWQWGTVVWLCSLDGKRMDGNGAKRSDTFANDPLVNRTIWNQVPFQIYFSFSKCEK